MKVTVKSMSYQHDIFISYLCNPETYTWIEEHFKPLLELLGRAWIQAAHPMFMSITRLRLGTSWPNSLGTALGASRTIIVLWSANYLEL